MPFYENLLAWLEVANRYLWGPYLLLPLFFSATTAFFLMRGAVLRGASLLFTRNILFSKNRKKGPLFSSFHSVTLLLTILTTPLRLAAIAGIILIGGAGVVFYMWLFMPFAMVLVFCESLNTLYLKKNTATAEDRFSGNVLFYGQGAPKKTLAFLFALFLLLSAFGIGNIFQVTTVATLIEQKFSLSAFFVTLLLAMLSALFLSCGRRRAIGYIGVLLTVLLLVYSIGVYHYLAKESLFYDTVQRIMRSAFSWSSLGGGSLLIALTLGLERNLFGGGGFGFSAVAHGESERVSPYRQASIASLAIPIDTLLLASPTALVVVASGVWETVDYSAFALLQHSFAIFLPYGDELILGFVACLTFSAILGWQYYAEHAFFYIFGTRFIMVFRYFWFISIALAPLLAPFLAPRAFLLIADNAHAALALVVLVALWLFFITYRQLTKEGTHLAI